MENQTADIMYDEFLQVKKDFGMLYMQERKEVDVKEDSKQLQMQEQSSIDLASDEIVQETKINFHA